MIHDTRLATLLRTQCLIFHRYCWFSAFPFNHLSSVFCYKGCEVRVKGLGHRASSVLPTVLLMPTQKGTVLGSFLFLQDCSAALLGEYNRVT